MQHVDYLDSRREAIEAFFTRHAQTEGQVDWRMQCYDDGHEYARAIEREHYPLAGKRVLDLSCAWGGHAFAFAARGAHVTAADLKDHQFDALRNFATEQRLSMRVLQADCQAVPLNEQYDVILALDLIEHIPDPRAMASEIKRLLAPGGVCLITTPPRLLSILWGEPHWVGLRGLALLPLRAQRWVAEHIFRRRYPYPIERQYVFARQVGRLFPGLQWRAVPASRKVPISSLLWDRIEITQPVSAVRHQHATDAAAKAA
jgi:SAM-dependent methyltransferase